MEKRTVLFVDDDEKVLKSLKYGLLDEPYEALFADSGEKAFEILQHKRVHVIVVDMLMPGMPGLQLLIVVKKKYPHIVRMVLSGFTQTSTLLTAINQGDIFKYIPKPWQLEEEFKPAVREAIEHYHRGRHYRTNRVRQNLASNTGGTKRED